MNKQVCLKMQFLTLCIIASQHLNYSDNIMAYYYDIPKKNTISKSQILHIQQQNQLKFSSQQSIFPQILFLNMKNTKCNDQSTLCLAFVQTQLKIETIDISENFSFITNDTIENLCSCKGLINLKSINLADNSISDVGIEMLSNHSNFQKLKTLIVYGNADITWISFASLAKSEWVKGLQKLDFHATSIADKGLVEFFHSENSKALTELDISMNWNRITDNTLEALAKSQYSKNIKVLNLQDCSISDNGVILLTSSPNASSLQSLNLSNSIEKSKNRITDKSLEALAYSKSILNLKTLYLKSTGVSSAGIKYLTSSHIIEKLEVLKLSQCKLVDDIALIHIGIMINYTNLTKLHVNSTAVTREAGEEFEEKYPKIMIIY